MNKRRIVSLLLALALCLGLSAPALAAGKFTDVPPTSPFAAAIDWAVEKNIANGTTPTTFEPGKTCSVSQILRFLWRASGRPGDTGNEGKAVEAWAAEHNLWGDFYQGCNRAEAVWLIWKIKGEPAPAKEANFSDVMTNSMYRTVISWAVEAGITQGTGNGTFSPAAFCTRGQIVTFLYRAYGDSLAVAPEAVPRPTTIDVSSNTVTDSTNHVITSWTVADNGYPTGTLNNGQPITEENVCALIKEMKDTGYWPDGMVWGDTIKTTLPNNCYNTKDAKQMLELSNRIDTSTRGGCGGFAALVSDYVFGKTSNPIRRLEDNSKVRVGDIMVYRYPDTNVVWHVTVFTSYEVSELTGETGLNHSDAGGVNGVITWRGSGSGVAQPEFFLGGNSVSRYEIWTRYPA